jgi:hypothetical protein
MLRLVEVGLSNLVLMKMIQYVPPQGVVEETSEAHVLRGLFRLSHPSERCLKLHQ